MDRAAAPATAPPSTPAPSSAEPPTNPLDRVVAAAHGRRGAVRTVSNASLVVVTAVLALADALIWATDPVIDTGRLSVSLAVLVPGIGLVAVVAVAYRLRRPVGALIALAGVSLALSTISFAVGTSLPPSFAALFALGLITATVLRAEPGRAAVALTILAGFAVAAEALRPQVSSAAYLLVVVMAAFAAAVGIGVYLRWSDWQRVSEAQTARTEERLEIARELHDIVGHHLTGIVVQAQAARHVAQRRPEAATDALDHIGREGTEALAAMRWMVGALREHEALGSGWADVERLATLATAPGLAVTTAIDPHVPPLTEAQAPVAYRVVAEAITNARRHGRTTSAIQIAATVDRDRLVLTVSDDGSPATDEADATRGSRVGNGSGLRGLEERLTELGGSLAAGPGADGGWAVRAEIPVEPVR
ncbi:MAG: sensor histidine kinase [Aquihabitans sp.]